MRPGLLALLAISGCSRDQGFYTPEGVTIEVTSPAYGAFLGDGPIAVTGRVTPATATVRIEGELVAVDANGGFTASLPFDHAYRIVDVEGASGATYERVRVPVFAGRDPLETWPGGITARVTETGLARVGEGLGGVIDSMGWSDLVLAALPSFESDYVDLVPTAVTHSPTVVELHPAEGGIDTRISLRDVTIAADLTLTLWDWTYTTPLSIGYGEIEIGALAVPDVDDDGMVTLSLTDSTIAFDEPEVAVGDLDAWVVELLMEGVSALVEPLGELLLDFVLESFGTVELGGPYAFSTDLMGVSLDARLADVYGDLYGLGIALGLGIDTPAPEGELPIPAPSNELDAAGAPVHAAIGLHEGLFQAVMSDELLSTFDQDLDLGGAYGELIGAAITALPGGSSAPEGDGWCLSMAPGDARVVRLQDGLDPLAIVYLPDFRVDIGILHGAACKPWLEASLAAEVGLRVSGGTALSMDLDIREGAVLAYAATSDWEEDEVIEGLAVWVEGAMALLGGGFSIDLADLAGGFESMDPTGGLLGEIEPKLVASEPMLDADGRPIEGLYAVGLQLWPEDGE